MQDQDGEIHIETDEARGGESQGTMRWVLGIGTLLAIVLLSIIWITGALSQGDVESEATMSGKIQAADETVGENTDSIVSENADKIEGAAPAQE